MQISPELKAIAKERKRQKVSAPNIAIGSGPERDGRRMVAQGKCKACELQEHLVRAIAERQVMEVKAEDVYRKYQLGKVVR